MDSTSCLKESAKTDDPKQGNLPQLDHCIFKKTCSRQGFQRQEKTVQFQYFLLKCLGVIFLAEAGGSGEESDVLSINADTYDSDIEGPKEEQSAKTVNAPLRVGDSNGEGADPAVKPEPANPEIPKDSEPVEAKKDIQMDIDKSVSEILAFSNTLNKEEADKQSAPLQAAAAAALPVESGPGSSRAPAPSQPSAQQLELLELEMRARAIKALMKASNGKKLSEANQV